MASQRKPLHLSCTWKDGHFWMDTMGRASQQRKQQVQRLRDVKQRACGRSHCRLCCGRGREGGSGAGSRWVLCTTLTLEGFLSMKLHGRPGAAQEASAEASRQVSDGVEVRLTIDGGDGEGLKGQT